MWNQPDDRMIVRGATRAYLLTNGEMRVRSHLEVLRMLGGVTAADLESPGRSPCALGGREP